MRFPLLLTTSATRTAVALLLPFAITGIQWLFWDAIRPFVWFLYFPTVFISAWLGSLRVGIIATVFSAMLARFFFMPPHFSLVITGAMQLFDMLMIFCLGSLFSIFNKCFCRASQQAVSALEQQAEQAVELIFWKEADGRELEMIRLKKQVNELSQQLDHPPLYNLEYASIMQPGQGKGKI